MMDTPDAIDNEEYIRHIQDLTADLEASIRFAVHSKGLDADSVFVVLVRLMEDMLDTTTFENDPEYRREFVRECMQIILERLEAK
jgi:hypothetical protein